MDHVTVNTQPRETSRRCSKSVKVMIDTILCCQSQRISLGRRLDGSGHLDSQMSLQALKIRSFMRFTCSTGSVMPSITCTTSGWHTVSCSTVIPRQVMEDTTSTRGHSEERWKTYQECQRSQGKRILRIVIDQDSMSYTDEVKYKKVKLHQFFSFHQIWSAETEMFNICQSASSFMTQHVLYHESVAISNWYLAETILEIMQHPQVRLTLRESSKSFEAVILTWKLFSHQVANSVNQSPSWR